MQDAIYVSSSDVVIRRWVFASAVVTGSSAGSPPLAITYLIWLSSVNIHLVFKRPSSFLLLFLIFRVWLH